MVDDACGIRDKPVYCCEDCGRPIYAMDIGTNLAFSSRLPKDTPIHCPHCRAIGTIGAVRKYEG